MIIVTFVAVIVVIIHCYCSGNVFWRTSNYFPNSSTDFTETLRRPFVQPAINIYIYIIFAYLVLPCILHSFYTATKSVGFYDFVCLFVGYEKFI